VHTVKAPRLVDVAALAGVTIGTASKALSGSGALKHETRQRVLAAADRLNYRANNAARALTSGRSYTVGLLTSDSLGRFSIPVMLGAEDSLATGQMAILFCDARADPVREQHWLQTLVARNVDGIIVTSHRSDARPSISKLVPVPVVYAYSPSDDPEDTSVIPDDEHGGRLAGEHLTNVGRQRLVYVGGPTSFTASHLRLRGFQMAIDGTGAELVTPPIFTDWEEDGGRQAARILLQRGVTFDGVFCASDQIARGFLDEVHARGIRVPEDIALVGFDNWEVMTGATRPRLTSIDMNLKRVGEVAATRLLDLIAGDSRPGEEFVPSELYIRESSA
jgi:LacI family transcriptional regulator